MGEFISKVMSDANGNPSSKRWIGFALCILGAGTLLAAAIVALTVEKTLPSISTAVDAGWTMLGVGGGLLGIGVVEHIAAAKKAAKE